MIHPVKSQHFGAMVGGLILDAFHEDHQFVNQHGEGPALGSDLVLVPFQWLAANTPRLAPKKTAKRRH